MSELDELENLQIAEEAEPFVWDATKHCANQGCNGGQAYSFGNKMFCSFDCRNKHFHLQADGTPDKRLKIWKDLEPDAQEAFEEYIEYFENTDIETFRDVWQPTSTLTVSDFARELCTEFNYAELEALPSFIRDNINWQAVWSDALTYDYVLVHNHYFRRY